MQHSLIGQYMSKGKRKRFDYIYKNYERFPIIIMNYKESLVELISAQKEYNRNVQKGDPGVRVQSTNIFTDITAQTAIEHVTMCEVIESGKVTDEFLKDTDNPEELNNAVMELRLMQQEYSIFNKQLLLMDGNEIKLLLPYMRGQTNLYKLSAELEIEYESARTRIYRIRRKFMENTIAFFINIEKQGKEGA